MQRVIVFLILEMAILSAGKLLAQNTSAIGRFQVNYARGCPPFTLEITELIPFDETFYQFQDSITSQTTYTFDSVGTYTIYQFIQEDNNPNGKIDSIQLILHESRQPDFAIFTCPGNNVAVEITEDYYDFYRVFFSPTNTLDVLPFETTPFVQNTPGNTQITVQGFFDGGSPSCGSNTRTFIPEASIPPADFNRLAVLQDTIAVINYDIPQGFDYSLERLENDSSFTPIATLDPSIDFYDYYKSDLSAEDCFRIVTTDACDGSLIASDTLCVLDLNIANAPEGNTINFNSQISSQITVFKDSIPVYIGSAGTFVDTDLTCNVQNCYVARQGKSFSQSICITPTDILIQESPENLQSTFVGSNLELSWELPDEIDAQSYILYRSNRPSSIFGQDQTYVIEGRQALQNATYALEFVDECGNESTRSNVTQPVVLDAQKLEDGLYELSWNRYEGWPEGIKHYFLQIQDENGNWSEETLIFSGRSIEVRPAQSIATYRIRAISALDNPRESFSNPVTLEGQPTLLLPNAFTPNEDGLNESFRAVGSDIFNFQMLIFNQWGEILFESKDIDVGWTGFYKGALMPPGYYMYKVQFEDDRGNIFEQRGNFVLIR